jgi:SAM-dependent methyltransferase
MTLTSTTAAELGVAQTIRWAGGRRSLADRVSAHSRRRKYDQFLRLMAPLPHERIIDVGVNVREYSDADNYLERHYSFPENITAVGLQDMAPFEARYPKVRAIQGDGLHLPFGDDEFGIVYSNAVIEHVGGREKQERFLRELFRVGRRGYLTTPNRMFPIEVHTRLPLLHLLLPKPRFDVLIRWMGKGWATGEYMHLLSERDLRQLLSSAGVKDFQILHNRLLGLPMTLTAIWAK